MQLRPMTFLSKVAIALTVIVLLFGYAWIEGLLQQVLAVDHLHVAFFVFILFGCGCVSIFYTALMIAYRTNRIVHSVRQRHDRKSFEIFAARQLLLPQHITNSLMLLGLIGTALGLVVGLLQLKGMSIDNPTEVARVVGIMLINLGSAFSISLSALICSLGMSTLTMLIKAEIYHMIASFNDRLSNQANEAKQQWTLPPVYTKKDISGDEMVAKI